MKTTYVFLSMIALAAAFGPSIARAETGGTDVGGGGEVVIVDGRPSLRDLVDNTVCTWVTGNSFKATLTYFPTVMQALEQTHWYFAASLPNELSKLTFCLTEGDLRQVDTEDQDGLTIYYLPGETRQVAVRINDRVYLDTKLFGALDERNQAYLVVHETMHTYIALNASQRNSKLRSMVRTIEKNVSSPLSKKDFGLQLAMNLVDIVPTTETLDASMSAVKGALDSSLSLRARIIHAYNITDEAWSGLRESDSNIISTLRKTVDTELVTAIQDGDVESVRTLIAQIGPNIIYYFPRIKKQGDTLLTTAIKAQHAAMIDLILAQSFFENQIDVEAVQETIMRNDQLNLEKILATKGALVRFDDFDGWFLFTAIKFDKLAVRDSLLARGAKLNIWQILELNKPEMVQLISKDRAQFLRDAGLTPLMAAARDGNLTMVNALLALTWGNVNNEINSVNAVDKAGKTPLHYAISNGQTRIALRLLRAGANVNKADEYGTTALIAASKKGNEKLVQAFLKVRGVKVNLRDENGESALSAAAEAGAGEIVERLVDAGADPALKASRRHSIFTKWTGGSNENYPGYPDTTLKSDLTRTKEITVLMFAAMGGNLRALNAVLSVSDLKAINATATEIGQPSYSHYDTELRKWTALQFAVFSDHLEVVRRLLSLKGIDTKGTIELAKSKDMIALLKGKKRK